MQLTAPPTHTPTDTSPGGPDGRSRGDTGVPLLLKMLVFMIACDPTGYFTLGDIGVSGVRISPLELVATVVLMMSLFTHGDRLRLLPARVMVPLLLLLAMILLNAIQGLSSFGPKALNLTRYQYGLVMVIIIPLAVRNEKGIRQLITVAIVAACANIVTEVLLELQVLDFFLVRREELRSVPPLYDTSVMIGSFLLLGLLVRRFLGRPFGLLRGVGAMVLLVVLVMSLVRAVWLGFALSLAVLMLTMVPRARLRTYVPMIAVGAFVALFLITQYESLFGTRGDNFVVMGKSETLFSASEDRDLLFRVLTALPVLEGLTSGIDRFVLGFPHGTEFTYIDLEGSDIQIKLHNAYLNTFQDAGFIGLVALVLLQWRILAAAFSIGRKSTGFVAWLAYTVAGSLVAIYSNMMFNSNGEERNYILFFLMGTVVSLQLLYESRGRGDAATEEGRTTGGGAVTA